MSARAIGAIEISDRFSIVEVAEDVAQDVIRALRDTTLRGKKVTVRRERGDGDTAEQRRKKSKRD